MATGVLGPTVAYWRSWLALRYTELSGIRLRPVLTVWDEAILAGLLVLVLASAWRHGAELQREQDLTV